MAGSAAGNTVRRDAGVLVMCGFAGILTASALGNAELTDRVQRMTCPLAHRGPDDGGVWVD
jgi:asparagine synthetase B (glutamine-hydrolysing)